MAIQLFFGDTEVITNQVIDVATARLPLTYDISEFIASETKNITIILLNLTNNYLHYLAYNDIPIVSYVAPFLEGLYMFYVFESLHSYRMKSHERSESSLRPTLTDRNKFSSNKPSMFGAMMGKIRFSVKNNYFSLKKLLLDNIRYIASSTDLSINEILNLCMSDSSLNNICNEDILYDSLQYNRLSTKNIYIPSLRYVLREYDNILKLYKKEKLDDSDFRKEGRDIDDMYYSISRILHEFIDYEIAIKNIISLLPTKWWNTLEDGNMKIYYLNEILSIGHKRVNASDLSEVKNYVLKYSGLIYNTLTLEEKIEIPLNYRINDAFFENEDPEGVFIKTFYEEIFFRDPAITKEVKTQIATTLRDEGNYPIIWNLHQVYGRIEDGFIKDSIREMLGL